jgi:hypothetical protein
VHNLGADNVNGIVSSIVADYAGATSGGGTLFITADLPGTTPVAPPPRRANAMTTSVITLDKKPKTVELATSNIAQYHVGGHVANLGADGSTHGTIRSIVPDQAGAVEGPGRIFITPKKEGAAPAPSVSRSASGSGGSAGGKEGTAEDASRLLRNGGPLALVNRKVCILDVTGGRTGTVVKLKQALGKSTLHVVRFDAGGPDETLQLQKSEDAKGIKFTVFS